MLGTLTNWVWSHIKTLLLGCQHINVNSKLLYVGLKIIGWWQLSVWWVEDLHHRGSHIVFGKCYFDNCKFEDTNLQLRFDQYNFKMENDSLTTVRVVYNPWCDRFRNNIYSKE